MCTLLVGFDSASTASNKGGSGGLLWPGGPGLCRKPQIAHLLSFRCTIARGWVRSTGPRCVADWLRDELAMSAIKSLHRGSRV